MTEKENTKHVSGILDPDGIYANPLTGYPYSESYRDLSRVWSKLPAYHNASDTISSINSHQVILVVSGTGSGKTVLFPKFVLHALNYEKKIAVTLPKQIITKSAAAYAAATLDVNLGEEVGYQFRGSDKKSNSSKTKLLYCTDGTLVARLNTDPKLTDFDAVLIDEAHERKMNIDLMLYMLRNVLKERPEFKLIIMSATINENLFLKYYKDFSYKTISIGTKPNYHIESVFLNENIDRDNYIKYGKDIIKKIIAKRKQDQNQIKDINNNVIKDQNKGGILFFVTSIKETRDVCDILKLDGMLDTNICVSVYSGMNEENQKIATDESYYKTLTTDDGIKIIIATNVAESSLTIDGITDVIDSGLELKSRFDPVKRIDILEKSYITNAQARQRMGRTGRTTPGTCYHLYTENVFQNIMEKYPAPSIRVESISNEILKFLTLPNTSTISDVKNTFQQFIEPPFEEFVNSEISYLNDMKLITSITNSGHITNYGKLIVDLNLKPSECLSLELAYRLFCYNEVLSIICVINSIKGSIDNLFNLPIDTNINSDDTNIDKNNDKNKNRMKRLMEKLNNAKKTYINRYGDHIAILKIFEDYKNKRSDNEKLKKWLYKNFIDRSVLDDAYKQFKRINYRYKQILTDFTSTFNKIKQPILNTDVKYKVLASFIFGNKLNVLTPNKNTLQSKHFNVDNIQIEKNSFINNITKKSNKKTKKIFYDQLYRFDNNPIQAKIVSFISNKSVDIINNL